MRYDTATAAHATTHATTRYGTRYNAAHYMTNTALALFLFSSLSLLTC